ncbi:hypothetical protein NBE99_04600 [Thermosynechococcus sp. HN-54]|uniref:hypothetical protein n=1 Tax=Thermosynechococcus sp. HN-54 TaxID=2933959 RepID=UPI00202CBA22|nr:hypothetical protein [Thermosynechococcus sp. HN-54]URR36420.1 hypothetical protein NBE99_04600 [Thermosynechococcus sp. HN-54]
MERTEGTVSGFLRLTEELKQKYSLSDLELGEVMLRALELREVGFEGLNKYPQTVDADINPETVLGGILLGGSAGGIAGELAGGLLLGGVVGGAVIGSILVGLSLSAEGEKALTEAEKKLTRAKEYVAEIDEKITTMAAYIRYLKDGVQRRIQELESVLKNLDQRCQRALNELEVAIKQGFDIQREEDVQKFQKALLLVKALREIIRTPLLDRDGNLNPEHTRLLAAYRQSASLSRRRKCFTINFRKKLSSVEQQEQQSFSI